MADFVIYKYTFSKASERELLFESPDGELVKLSAREHLDRFLVGRSLTGFNKKERDGGYIPLQCDLLFKDDDVALLALCDAKKVTFWDQYQKKQIDSHPFSHVIIDNREGVAQIAVERNSAFGSKDGTDRVCNILTDFINSSLKPFGWKVEITRKSRSVDVWDVVTDRVKMNDIVKSVRFNFRDPQKTEGIDATESQIKQMRLLTSLSRAMGAVNSYLQLDATPDGALIFDKEQKDLAGMVALCGNNGWDIDITFRDFGVYRVGRLQSAVFSVTNDTVSDFATGQQCFCDGDSGVHYSLIQWLNEVRQYTQGYTYEDTNKQQRKANNSQPAE